ncbi:prepilin-type cleavage/methylation-like protein [uncultured Oceanisphaera sp.]|uniref:type IV pilus modification PilV family protein n=1 Tax=uncultured Oceanisphaera sp. TaxID=353858 RepID=UPI002635A694|nr:prepilin-type cleavage/methylation-like protein [uncultured Oceanisphaera sp.]
MRPSYYFHNRRHISGVSLVEYVLGLAILAIVLVGVGLFFLSQPRQLDPVFQFRAVSLAEALAEQVLAVKYDGNNNPAAQERCGINGVTACANSPQASTTNITDFKVVDDFQLWCGANAVDGQTLASDLGLSSSELYSRFSVATCVETPAPLTPGYDETDPALFMKKVSINISIDQGDTLSFILHRYNIR